jgi:hypothetical protein
MRPMLRLVDRMAGTSRRGLVLAMALVPLATLGAAPPALASKKKQLQEEFLPFAHCPLEAAKVCMVSTTTGGEFVIDRKTVPIEVPVTLQGGLATVLDTETLYESSPLIGASGASTLSETPLTVPGGLVGIGGLGGEVTATAELAGPPSSVIINRWNLLAGKTPAVILPLKVKLSNEVLGEECYIGSDAEPIVLHLTTGTTSPPSPGEPIKGSIGAGVGGKAKGKITYIENATLVDNDFAVPGASGCGGALSPVVDEAVDLDVGIPAPAGENTAIMSGALEETAAQFVAEYKPKEKKEKKKKK